MFEYNLNNSTSPAAQWAAIQSGITAVGLVAKLTNLPTNDVLQQLGTGSRTLALRHPADTNSTNFPCRAVVCSRLKPTSRT